MNINDIQIGKKYEVIKNRETQFGSCTDLIEIEGQQIEVISIIQHYANEPSIYIRDMVGSTHYCQAKNLAITEEVIENPIKKKKEKIEILHYIEQPHDTNWTIKSNLDKDIITLPQHNTGINVKIILNGLTTVAILDDGSKGIARCLETDVYNKEKGMDIAFYKALIKSLTKTVKQLSK